LEKRIAVIGIIIEEIDYAEYVNEILHEYNSIIIGRMGIPYRERGISVISLAVDADADTISGLTGKLGKIRGVSVKAAISKK
jgi:putative iron-only hydrogenase system regulator